MKSKLNKRRGFTIVEIILAVTIMAILVAAVMNGLKGSSQEARKKMWNAECTKELQHAVSLIEQYLIENPSATPSDAKTTTLNELRKDPTGKSYELSITSAGTVTITPSTAVKNVTGTTYVGTVWQ